MSNLLAITAKSDFVPPFGGLGVTYTVHLWLVGKRVDDFLLVQIELFSLPLTVEALQEDIGRNRCVRRGGVTLSTNFRGNGESPTNDCWHQKTRVHGLSYGVVCMILCFGVL